MDYARIPLLSLLSKKMGWLQQRQVVLSQNVANGDTPGYEAKDLKAFDFRRELAGANDKLSAHRTDGKHLAGAGHAGTGGSGPRAVRKAGDRYEASPQGNTVVLEEEMLKISDTQMDHTMLANLYRKQIGLLKLALGTRG